MYRIMERHIWIYITMQILPYMKQNGRGKTAIPFIIGKSGNKMVFDVALG